MEYPCPTGVLDGHGENQSMESGARALADVLRAWTAQVQAGVIIPRLIEAKDARAVASTDLTDPALSWRTGTGGVRSRFDPDEGAGK